MTSRESIQNPPKLRLGVSSCLLGEKVRYNGGHTRNDFMLNTLGPWVEWVAVCPEVEIGLGVPRESLRLIGDLEAPRMLGAKSGTDHTDTMNSWSPERIQALKDQKLDGYILKKGSPSCGLFKVKVYQIKGEQQIPMSKGRGLFADSLTRALPLMPVEEEGRLNDAKLRENFIERIYAHHRWQRLNESSSVRGLMEFHADFKMTLMAHSPAGQQSLGRRVAGAKEPDLPELMEEYGKRFFEILTLVTTPERHTNVLQHLMGFLKNHLDSGDKAELVDVIHEYRLGRLPLIVPITLLKHHFRRNEMPEWLDRQVYLNPYPGELMLRNRI